MESVKKISVSDRDNIQDLETNREVKILNNVQAPPKKSSLPYIILIISVLAAIFLVGIILIIVFTHDGNKDSDKDDSNYSAYTTTYGIFVDAGSSSCRLYDYSWPNSSFKDLPLYLKELNSKKFTPSLHKLESVDNDTIDKYAQNMIDFAKTDITTQSNEVVKSYEKLPFFLRATAGMRSISKVQQDRIISRVQAKVKDSGFFYIDDFIKVINGTEEGVYGWISVNYLNGALEKNSNAKKEVEKTHGALDLGGSSLEITFVPASGTVIEKDEYKLNPGNYEYKLYAHCFTGLGQDEFLKKLKNYYIKNYKGDDTRIEFPCFLKGTPEDDNNKYEYEDKNYTFIGTGNFSECYSTIKKILKVTDVENMSIDGTYQPSVKDLKFVAFSGFGYASNSLGVPNDEYSSPNDVKIKVEKYCQMNYNYVNALYNIEGDEYKRIYCYSGAYIYTLLVDAFKFDSQAKNIMFTNNIKGTSLTWAYGDMAYEIGLLPYF